MNSHDQDSLAPRSPMLEEQAAEWLALRRARPLTDSEAAALEEWKSSDPRNRAIFAEIESADRRFDRLAFYPCEVDRVDPDLLHPQPPRHHRWLAAGAAMAAAALALLVWYRPATTAPQTPASAVSTSARFLTLSDGSRVELNEGSAVTEHFTAAERRVRLVRGEAHFDVAKNPLRPFIVEAQGVAVRAVGTAFDVRLLPDRVDVLVTEGKVGVVPGMETGLKKVPDAPKLLPDGEGLILVAGQRTTIPVVAPGGTAVNLVVETLAKREIDVALAWQRSRLAFDSVPLAEVVMRLNQTFSEINQGDQRRLSVDGRRLEALRISGRIRADRFDNFVEVLQNEFGVRVERRGNEIILHDAR